jgi:predicted transcriptional regulator
MNRKIRFSLILSTIVLLVSFLGYGCRASSSDVVRTMEVEAPVEMAEEAEAFSAPSQPVSGAAEAASAANIERLIIRNASLEVTVKDTEAAIETLNGIVDEAGGYIVESSVYKYQENKRASVTLRIPAEKLDETLEQIREIATEVQRESVSGQDVTEEYVDLKSRLRYLEATEARLLEFLEDAEDTEAALAVYDKLQGIQADIERVKGRMQYLEQSAAMATVNLTITPDALAQPIHVKGWRPGGTARQAIEALISVLQFFIDALIVIVLLIFPVLLIIAAPVAGMIYVIRAILRRRRARKKDE